MARAETDAFKRSLRQIEEAAATRRLRREALARAIERARVDLAFVQHLVDRSASEEVGRPRRRAWRFLAAGLPSLTALELVLALPFLQRGLRAAVAAGAVAPAAVDVAIVEPAPVVLAPDEVVPDEAVPDEVDPDAGGAPAVHCQPGARCAMLSVRAFPFEDRNTTLGATEDSIEIYSCDPEVSEAGGEVWYVLTLPSAGRLTASIAPEEGTDVDVHLLSAPEGSACVARGDNHLRAHVEAGAWYVVVDTFARGGVERAGPYTLRLGFESDP